MIEDIKANILTISQIAEKHGVIKQTVYNVKSRFVSPADIAEDVAPNPDLSGPRQEPVQEVPTAYMQSRERLETKPDVDLNDEIAKMVAEGLSLSELEMMFPSVPVTTLSEIHRTYRPG